MGLFLISTSSVDNIVDKPLLTRQNARICGVLLNLPIPQAKINALKFKHLACCYKLGISVYAANSYKMSWRGISPPGAAPRSALPAYFQLFLARSRTSMRTLSGMGLRLWRVVASTQTHSSKCLSMAGARKRLRAA